MTAPGAALVEPALAVRGLSVSLERKGLYSLVLDDVTFDVGRGEFVALVGESGSGKSTIGHAIQALLDMRAKVSGSVRVAGVEMVGASDPVARSARRSLVRSIPQEPLSALDPTMRVARQMAAPGSTRQGIVDWLRRTGLTQPERAANSFPHKLSGGERQRVLIAMAMMAQPHLLIADEPTTALDSLTQVQVLNLMRQLACEQGSAILFITHDLSVAASLADRILVLDGGRIVESAPTRTLIATPAHASTKRLLAARYDLRTKRTPARANETPTPKPEGRAPALKLVNISRTFRSGLWGNRSLSVLQNVSFSIAPGECLALVGESGAGKSTLLRISAGLAAPNHGQVSRVGSAQVVSQDPLAALTPWLSIREQVGERLRHLRLPASTFNRRIEEAFEMVGLPIGLERSLPSELSLGQCQRAMLARAIIVPPDLLLCDEPISAMDSVLAASILALLVDLRHRLGLAMLFVTHDIAAARLVADRIVVLKDGAVVEEGEAEAITSMPVEDYTKLLLGAVHSRDVRS